MLLVAVESSLFVHKSSGGYFRRLGSSKRELASDLLARLFHERSQSRMIRFDESAVPGTGPGDLDYALTRRFLREDGAEQEALVNAVAHRDYSIAGARIRLHLFGDRLELYVPGALANTLTPDSLHLRQASRNELIVSLLARCPAPTGLGRVHVMDRRGDGVPIAAVIPAT